MKTFLWRLVNFKIPKKDQIYFGFRILTAKNKVKRQKPKDVVNM